MDIRISLTGRIAIRGQRLAADESRLGGQQSKIAFSLLVIERHHAVPKDTMADVIWAGYPPPSWEASLRRIVSRVRSFIAEAKLDDPIRIIATSGCYQLDLPTEAVVDIEYAKQLLDSAVEDMQLGNLDKAFEEAERARSLFKRPFLPGIDIPWVDERRREQKAMLVKTLETMVDIKLSSTHPEQAVSLAEEALGLEPFRESIYRQLMSAYLHSGNRVEGLRTHERLRKLFSEELGANPSPETEELYLQLLSDTPIERSAGLPWTSKDLWLQEEREETRKSVRPVSSWSSETKLQQLHLPDYMMDMANSLMVGRAAEMETLIRSWRNAVTATSSGVILAGRAGTGKTFIVAHLAKQAISDGGLLFIGRCRSRWSHPYAPFAEMIHGYLTQFHLTTQPVTARQLPSLLAPLLTGEGSGSSVASPQDLFDSDNGMKGRLKLFEEMASWMASVSSGRPLLVVVEDVHLADPSSLGLIHYLLGSQKLTKTTIVITYNPDHLLGYDELSVFLTKVGSSKDLVQLEIDGFPEEEVAFLLLPYIRRYPSWTAGRSSEGLSSSPMDDPQIKQLSKAVYRLTQGNPLAIRYLLERLQADRDLDTPMHAETALAAFDPPDGHLILDDLIEEELSRLSNNSMQVLAIASALGDEFDVGLLMEVISNVKPSIKEEESVLEGLDSARTNGLIVDVAVDQDKAIFAHSLIRSVIYEHLSTARRIRIHRQICMAIENRRNHQAGRLAPNMMFSLAEHAMLAAPLGEEDKAIHYSKEAGDISYAVFCLKKTIQYYTTALKLMTPTALASSTNTSPERQRLQCRILLATGKALQSIGEQQHRTILLKASHLAEQLKDPQLLAGAALALSSSNLPSLNTYKPEEEVIEALKAAEELLPSGYPALRAKLLAAQAAESLDNSRLRKRLALVNRAIGIARLHSEDLAGKSVLAEVLAKCHQALLGPDALSQRSKQALELISLGRDLNDKEILLRGQLFYFDSLMEQGRIVEALNLLEQSATTAHDLGHHFNWELAIRKVGIAILEGKMDLAESLANQALLLGKHGGVQERVGVAVYGAQILSIRAEQGRLIELNELVSQLSIREPDMPEWPLIQAYAWLQAGMNRKASHYLKSVIDHIETFPRQAAWLADMVLLARVCSAVGDDAEAAIIAEKLEPFSGRLAWGIAVSSGPVDYALGLLAAVRKDFHLAELYLRKSIETSNSLHAIPYLIRSRIKLAQVISAQTKNSSSGELDALAKQASATAAALGLDYLSISTMP